MTKVEKQMRALGLDLPRNKGYIAYYKNEKGDMITIGNPTKSKSWARKYADDYMLRHEVKTYVAECIF